MFPAYQAHHWWWCSTRRNIRWIVDVEILLSFGFVWFIHPPSQLIHPGSCPKNVDFADGQSHRTLTSVRPFISRYFFQHHIFFGGSICEKTTSPFLDPQIKKSDRWGTLGPKIIPPCCWKITHHVSCWSWVKKNERPRPWLQVRKRFLFRRRYVSWNICSANWAIFWRLSLWPISTVFSSLKNSPDRFTARPRVQGYLLQGRHRSRQEGATSASGTSWWWRLPYWFLLYKMVPQFVSHVGVLKNDNWI